jgi:hypothetical protein
MPTEAAMVAYGVFDSEALSLMQAALEQAWEALPPHQRTAETRERVAQAVVSLATQGERDPAHADAVFVDRDEPADPLTRIAYPV